MSEHPQQEEPMNCADSESSPVLGPGGNKARLADSRKPIAKQKSVAEKQSEAKVKRAPDPIAKSGPQLNCVSAPLVQRPREQKPVRSNLSLSASCWSDASSDSLQSRPSMVKSSRRRVTPIASRRKQCAASRKGKLDNVDTEVMSSTDVSADGSLVRKTCAWVTPNTDSCYAAFHDEEWGVPVRADKKLFELLSLSTVLAELTWPSILIRRHMCREMFHDFDPIAVSKLNEKKVAAPGSTGSSLLSEFKLRGIIENSRQVCKIADEFGSFDMYLWAFVKQKPIVGNFRYSRQVPMKTSKAESISKDLVRRGFRGVGPTVVYSFMQAAGITNDHLVGCFRFKECILAWEADTKDENLEVKAEGKRLTDANGSGSVVIVDELSLSPE